jgi:4-alpha-glucanotransferase
MACEIIEQTRKSMRFKRSSGILLHPVSFPGRFGIGDLGDAAYKFVDFLANSGQSLWQIMPLGPTGYGDSPYSSFSAFAGNTLLVSPERLVGDGLLNKGDVENVPAFATERVEYGEVIDYKRTLLGKAYENFKRQHDEQRRADYDGFLQSAAAWLDDYAVRSYWIPGSYAPALSENRNSFLRLLKNKDFKEERMTKVGLYAIG